jgi:electron transfer flavoprotein beta subunit
MPTIIACYKWVLNEADLRIGDDLSVDTSRAMMKISDYDKNAIQAAVDLAASCDATTLGLTYGDDRTKKSIKEVLSRGLDKLEWVNDAQASKADSRTAAHALAGAIAQHDDVRVVVCSDGSSDKFERQTAERIAALLGWPVATSVIGAHVADDGRLEVARQIDAGVEHVRIALPAVIAVLPEINEPPIPTLRQIIQAGKKPSEEVAPQDVPASTVQDEGMRGYAMARKNIIFESESESCIDDVVSALRKEGVL